MFFRKILSQKNFSQKNALPTELLLEVTIVETFEALTMTSFITSHLMDCIMKSIIVTLLAELSQLGLTSGCAVLSLCTNLQVLSGRRTYNLAQHLSILCCMNCFLIGNLLEI